MKSLLPLVVIISIALRWLVSLWSYSGQGKPPMHGDYEAQRHWMEITVNLPIGDWYRQTNDNDLQYWGLDYPPLTAYVSWLFGMIAQLVCPELVKLYVSRGYESISTKIFMRLSVLYCDMIIYFPAVTAFMISLTHRLSLIPGYNLLLILSNPALLLIDHGHFQYNSVCIALSLLAGVFVINDHDVIGSICFVLALNFKQMTLYYALIFFAILLRKCFIEPTIISKVMKLTMIGSTVVVSFAVLWLPFCIFHHEVETCLSSLGHVVHRLFPFNRGIFEDKVANIWYGVTILYDYRGMISMESLKLASGFLTLLLVSPTIYIMLSRRLTPVRLLLGLMNSSLAFFLASFQVHEKSLLLALIPASFLLNLDPFIFFWFQLLGAFSMFPLLIRDGLRIPYFCVLGIYTCMTIGYFIVALPSLSALYPKTTIQTIRTGFVVTSCAGMSVLHLLEAIISPPSRYPDLYPVLFALYSLGNLLVMYAVGVLFLLGMRDQTTKSSSNAGVNERRGKVPSLPIKPTRSSDAMNTHRGVNNSISADEHQDDDSNYDGVSISDQYHSTDNLHIADEFDLAPDDDYDVTTDDYQMKYKDQ